MNKKIIDVPVIFCEFLEVAIHTLLFTRKLYPNGIFTLKKKYGVPVHVSVHPELNRYITSTLFAIKHLLKNYNLKQVDVCFFNKERVMIERFVFSLNEYSIDLPENSSEAFLQQLKESFRAFCLKISLNSNFMKPLPEGSTFKIFIHTNEFSSSSLFEDPQFQDFPWVEAQKQAVTVDDPYIIPVRNIETDLLNIKIYTEENKNAK